MPRLPEPGKDAGQWGGILNDFLLQSHSPSGVLKDGSVTGSTIQDGAVTTDKLAELGQANGVASLDADGKLPETQLPSRLSEAELNDAIAQGSAGASVETFNHGTNAAAIRPVTSAPIIWVGTAQPSQWLNGDIWFDTSVAGGPSIPAMPSGLVAHWSVSDLSLANGATVTSWADRVGGLALTASGAPSYSGTVEAVSYDGVDDMHNAPLALAQPSTYITIFRLPSSTVSQPILGSETLIHSISTTSTSILQANHGASLQRSGVIPANTWMMASVVANGSSSGISVDAGARTSGGGGANGRTTVRVASNTAGTSFARLDVKSILVFNRALTDAELADVKANINSDLGMTL